MWVDCLLKDLILKPSYNRAILEWGIKSAGVTVCMCVAITTWEQGVRCIGAKSSSYQNKYSHCKK